MEQKTKRKHTKNIEKVPSKLNTSNSSLECSKRIYDHQIQQINLTLKESLNCPTLTEDELKILFVKYKLDGHYRTNKNLPPFNTLVRNTNDTFNGKHNFYDEAKHAMLSNMQEINCRNNNDITENLNYSTGNENRHAKGDLHTYRNIQQNLKHNSWKQKEIFRQNHVNDKIDGKYFCAEENFLANGNYNRTTSNYDIETHSDANIFNCTEKFDEFKSCLSINEIPNIEEQQFSCNVTNMQSVLSEESQSYGYSGKSIFYNASDSNAQYENLINCSEMSEQNDMKHAIHFNDLSLNSNLCNDFHLIKQNNVSSSINKNNNVQSWKSVEAVYTSYANTSESHYNVKNSTPYQYALVKSHPEEQTDCNSHARTNVYHLTSNESMSCIPNSSNINAEQNLNYYTSNSKVASDSFFPEINTLIPPYTSITNQHL